MNNILINKKSFDIKYYTYYFLKLYIYGFEKS